MIKLVLWIHRITLRIHGTHMTIKHLVILRLNKSKNMANLSELSALLWDVDFSVSEPVVVVLSLCSFLRLRFSIDVLTSVFSRIYFSLRQRYLSSNNLFSQRTFSYNLSSPTSRKRWRSISNSWCSLSFRSERCWRCSLLTISS